jgi:hypothetical protein
MEIVVQEGQPKFFKKHFQTRFQIVLVSLSLFPVHTGKKVLD